MSITSCAKAPAPIYLLVVYLVTLICIMFLSLKKVTYLQKLLHNMSDVFESVYILSCWTCDDCITQQTCSTGFPVSVPVLRPATSLSHSLSLARSLSFSVSPISQKLGDQIGVVFPRQTEVWIKEWPLFWNISSWSAIRLSTWSCLKNV